MITIRIEAQNTEALDPARLYQALVRGTQRAVLRIQRRAMLNLTGAFLKVQTGRLRASLTTRVEETATGVIGRVGTSVFYGAIHEYGVPRSWPIAARNRRALMFMLGGQKVFARTVTHPALQQRPWLSSAATASIPELQGDYELEIRATLGGAA